MLLIRRKELASIKTLITTTKKTKKKIKDLRRKMDTRKLKLINTNSKFCNIRKNVRREILLSKKRRIIFLRTIRI